MRRSLCGLCLAMLLALGISGALGVYAQSIAETVKKERDRRARDRTKAKVLTEADLKTASPGSNLSGQRATHPFSDPTGERSPERERVIPFTMKGNSMVVQAELNGRAQTRLIVDTGASLTSLSTAMAEAAGITISEKDILLPMHTANGVTMAPLVKVSTLRIGDVEVEDLDVVLLNNWSDQDAGGLLGMNVLNQFNWHTDLVKNRLVLKPNNRLADKETYGGYDKDWWTGRFRFLRHSREELQNRRDEATSAQEVAEMESAIAKIDAQMSTLNREANRVGVPSDWRR